MNHNLKELGATVCINGHDFASTLDSKNIYCRRCGYCFPINDELVSLKENVADHEKALGRLGAFDDSEEEGR